ncbi:MULTISPECIES: bifunctional UDP-sugar hydrolase/5'-nucleotidase UshA [unclassified Agarivorans]|uniref:bifunctional UDP-sugar hydrolase/5'-nucleotidase UshA n=1 Tax=unclassified Agarivorans TaxID=2636026 RepID=UPI0026E2E6DE|nr:MULTISPECIES: bifunctional UDP-sugar hydrolase/5'-nucleotidase UshA [unclassified Agarivorans]MDO6686122.1 bifunctional UDP-sugar hydrolase/5'-nucleotidase UshA [Agarivorans sp. 3_MG-2023]MDO6716429.1 bifunctional UDP-sugar hydrolase/5'-nucleotidase UshA [Agarivorans sp. 2_MG-2023]
MNLHSGIALVPTLLAASLLAACSSAPQQTWKVDQSYKITVLHTNDHHGRFWQNKYGEYGLAARKTLIDSIREEVAAKGGSVLLLSGGDINTGVPESDLLDAEPDFKGMNMLGYDAMALGNHEFDNSLEVLAKQQQWAGFPFLSANIYQKSNGERKFKPYHMFDLQGVKVAVIGFTTEDTYKLVHPDNVAGLEFRDPKLEAKHVIAELNQTEQPDLVFAVTHMGHYANAKHGVNAPGDVSLARSLNEGELDLIVGGHSQEPVCMEGPNMYTQTFKPGDECKPDKQNGTWIVQAYEWGKYVGRADYSFKNGEFTLDSYQLVPVNLKKKITVEGKKQRVFVQDEIPQNPEVLALLTPYQEQGQEQLGVNIAELRGRLVGDRNKVRFGQTNLGRLIATAHKERVNADFAVMNSGGVRASIEEGEVSYKDVLTVQPFSNTITYVDMSGSEVMDYLSVVAAMPVDTGAYAQFSGIGMKVVAGKVSEVVIGGKPLDEAASYRFTIPNFNASGGDGYPKITGHSGFVDTGFVDAEVLKAYLEQQSPVNAADYNDKGEISYK